MSYSLTWLPDVLQAAGLKVALVDGWQERGHSEMGRLLGVICHHTAGPRIGNMPSLNTLIRGRPDLPGPLAQLGLGRDGTFYVIAAGRCSHAGIGEWKGITAGNSHFIGIEAENAGAPADAWPEVQMDSYRRGVAAILKQIGQSEEYCVGHKEFAKPHGRKSDPLFDMNGFRVEVKAVLDGHGVTRPLIPAFESVAAGATARPTLRRGALGKLVEQIQQACGVNIDGYFGPKTEAAVRAFQRSKNLVPDGIVGPKTWQSLDEVRSSPG